MKTIIPELFPDPFEERCPLGLRREVHVLGAAVRFDSNSEDLLALADAAYAGLPRHRLSRVQPRLRIRLLLTSPGPKTTSWQPGALQMFSGAGLLAASTASSNFVVVSPRQLGALVVVPPQMLRFPYHIRYELIEFAVFTLTARTQGLVPLHSACVGRGGSGILLMGPSGAGKSTLTLQCLLEGWEILAEDSVFLTPESLVATGVSNFLHVRADSLRWIAGRSAAAKIRKAPVIRRRSGVRKHEIDLRSGEYSLAKRPLKIAAIIFLSAQRGGGAPLLQPLSLKRALAMLAHEQAYAAHQAAWPSFIRSVQRLQFFELRRGKHPRESVAALRGLIDPAARVTRRLRRV
jgi:hypothetical protein